MFLLTKRGNRNSLTLILLFNSELSGLLNKKKNRKYLLNRFILIYYITVINNLVL